MNKKWIGITAVAIGILLWLICSGLLKEGILAVMVMGAGAGYKHASQKTDNALEKTNQTIQNAKDYGKQVEEEVSTIDKETAAASIAELLDWANDNWSHRSKRKSADTPKP